MSVFDVAARSIFADANMATSATYTEGAFGVPRAVRVLFAAPDVQQRWNEAVISSVAVVIEVRVAEVATPAAGDGFTINGADYVVQGVPERDGQQLVWRIELGVGP